MSETTTEQVVDTSAAVTNSSTADTTTTSADSQASTESNQQVVQPASTETATNTGAEDENAALAKFAKGQGINDLSELSDRELSLLKMARDNKSSYDKAKQSQPKLDESSTDLTKLGDDATDFQKLNAKVINMEFTAKKTKFFEGKDANLEPVMSQVLAEKREAYGDDYARNLLNDLPTLYALAEARGTTDTTAAADAARRDERTSMNQNLAASSNGAQATNSKPQTPIKVTSEWIRNEYNPNNPEHRALVDAAMKR